jgi:hypothetical protein
MWALSAKGRNKMTKQEAKEIMHNEVIKQVAISSDDLVQILIKRCSESREFWLDVRDTLMLDRRIAYGFGISPRQQPRQLIFDYNHPTKCIEIE